MASYGRRFESVMTSKAGDAVNALASVSRLALPTSSSSSVDSSALDVFVAGRTDAIASLEHPTRTAYLRCKAQTSDNNRVHWLEHIDPDSAIMSSFGGDALIVKGVIDRTAKLVDASERKSDSSSAKSRADIDASIKRCSAVIEHIQKHFESHQEHIGSVQMLDFHVQISTGSDSKVQTINVEMHPSPIKQYHSIAPARVECLRRVAHILSNRLPQMAASLRDTVKLPAGPHIW